MKTRNKHIGLIALAIIAIAFTALPLASCKDAEDTSTTRTLNFTGATGTFSVTITSADAFTDAEWTTLCNKVVAAINARYETGSKGSFGVVFASDQNTKVVLGNNFTNNYEVKDGEFRTIYIKTASIDTVDFDKIVLLLENNTAFHE